jgi:hypothetical protein
MPTHDEFLRTTAAAIQTVEDPLVAEELASLLVASWSIGTPRDAGEPTERAVSAIAMLEQMNSVRTLVAVRAVTESDLRHLVDEAVRRLVFDGSRVVPDWAERLGRVELVESLHVTEVLRDQDLWVMRFHYLGDDPQISHVLTASIDRNRGGIIRDITLGQPETADLLFRAWLAAGDAQVSVAPGDPAKAAMDLATALARTDVTVGADITQEAFGLLPLLRSRVRALPPLDLSGPELAWRTTEDGADADALAAEFAAQISREPAGERLPLGVDAERLARRFLDSTGFADELLRWSPIRVEMVLLDWLPRKVILSPAEIEAAPDVLRAFVRWALKRQGVPDDAIEETVASVGRWEADFEAAMADESTYGSSKLSLLQMQRDGVDIDDGEAVGRWIDGHQSGTQQPAPGAP